MDYWSCGSLPKKGINHGHKGLNKWLQQDYEHTFYVLQCDIKKCYQCISHRKLKEILRRNFKDEKYLTLCDKVIDSFITDDPDILPFLMEPECGLPLGNYTSSWWCNLYLTQLDRYIRKFDKCYHYLRYVDDFCVLSDSKEELGKILAAVHKYAKTELKIIVKKSSRIYTVDERNPVDMLGYKHYHTHSTVRKRNAVKAIDAARTLIYKIEHNEVLTYHLCSSYLSRIGMFKHCDSYNFTQKYYSPEIVKIAKEVISNESRKRHHAKSS